MENKQQDAGAWIGEIQIEILIPHPTGPLCRAWGRRPMRVGSGPYPTLDCKIWAVFQVQNLSSAFPTTEPLLLLVWVATDSSSAGFLNMLFLHWSYFKWYLKVPAECINVNGSETCRLWFLSVGLRNFPLSSTYYFAFSEFSYNVKKILFFGKKKVWVRFEAFEHAKYSTRFILWTKTLLLII